MPRRRGGLIGLLARAAGRERAPATQPPPPEVGVLLPEPGPQPAPAPATGPAPAGADRGAAEAARRLDAARERLRREIPPAEG